MDRFLSQWKSHSAAATTMGRVSPGLALQQEEEEAQSDDSMEQFIEDDLDDDDEEAEQEERKDTLHRVQATGRVHKRVKLQMQLAGGSAAAARTKYKPGGEEPARSTVSAAAASSSSAAASASSRAASSSAARPAASSQPTLSRAQQNGQKLFQRRQPTNARPPAAAAAAASSAASSSAARPAFAASALPSSQSTRATASPAAASAAAPSLARAVSAPEPAATQPVAAVAAAAVAAVPRKRKHLAADDASPSSRSLVDLIEDWSDNDEDAVVLPRRSQIQQLLLKPVPKPTPPPPPPPRHRSVLSMMHAVQSGTIPFASQQFARLARRREARVEMQEEAARKAMERGEELEDHAVSMVSVGPFSSASAVMASSSSAAAGSSPTAASASPAAPCGSSIPHYASSAFRTSQVRHTELFHHSMKHLLWSRLSPVRDWSLSGEKAAASGGVPFDRFAPPPPPAALSYVTQLRFDHQGALLCASSNNGLVDLYDFDDVWMSGRRVEKTKRSRELRAREEYHRVANLIRGRADSPPRSQQKWKLNQPAPVLKPYASPPPPAHERIRPIFSMNLGAAAADVAESMAASQRSAAQQQAPILRQIDSQHWSSSNCNEIALSSQRSNHIYLFDVSRCDEQGSPHRRILLGDAFTPAHASCVMDFVYFPAAAARSSGGGSNGSGKALVAALRNGEINTLDLRVSTGVSSTDASKVFKAQQRATSSSVGLNNRPNPPASLQISGCGQKLYVFTEQGTLESWDTRLMRASFERVHLLESMWGDTHKGSRDAGTLGMHQPVLGRVCSSSIHPQDDHALLFQLLSGAVGLVDLNPCSPSFQSVRTVVPHSAAFVSSALDDQFSLRPKRTAVFLHNGQSGSNASSKRERIIAAADMESRLRIVESCSASACRSPPLDPRVRTSSSSDSMLDRELQRSSDSSSRQFASALSPSLHLLHTLPPPVDDSLAARYSSLPLSNPIMSLAAHPHAPFLLLGCKQQRIRIVSHGSELEDKMESMEIAAETSA